MTRSIHPLTKSTIRYKAKTLDIRDARDVVREMSDLADQIRSDRESAQCVRDVSTRDVGRE